MTSIAHDLGVVGSTHIAPEDLPWADLGDGSSFQLLMADLHKGVWVVRTRFMPGYCIPRHYHTGPVFSITLSGTWYYEERPEAMNSPGSFGYQPAHSKHTLIVPTSSVEPAVVWFAIDGAEIHEQPDGSFSHVQDALSMLKLYRELCGDGSLNSSLSKMIVLGE